MSHEELPYSVCALKAWTALSVFLGLVLLAMFVFGGPLLDAGQVVWDLIRWICTPII